MNYVSVTVTAAWENAAGYEPRTAVFSTREEAESFKAELEALFEEYDRSNDYFVTIDSGTVNSTGLAKDVEDELDEEFY